MSRAAAALMGFYEADGKTITPTARAPAFFAADTSLHDDSDDDDALTTTAAAAASTTTTMLPPRQNEEAPQSENRPTAFGSKTDPIAQATATTTSTTTAACTNSSHSRNNNGILEYDALSKLQWTRTATDHYGTIVVTPVDPTHCLLTLPPHSQWRAQHFSPDCSLLPADLDTQAVTALSPTNNNHHNHSNPDGSGILGNITAISNNGGTPKDPFRLSRDDTPSHTNLQLGGHHGHRPVPTVTQTQPPHASSLLLTFEAKARQGLCVGLTPYAARAGRERVEIVLHATDCTIAAHWRQWLPRNNNDDDNDTTKHTGRCPDSHRGYRGGDTTNHHHKPPQRYVARKQTVTAPARACRGDQWTQYWILAHRSTVALGVGSIPGEECVVVLHWSDDEDSPAPQPADTRSTLPGHGPCGAGTTALTVDTTVTPTVGAERTMPAVQFVGLRNAAKSHRCEPPPIHVRNLVLTNHILPDVQTKIASLQQRDLDMIILGEHEVDTLSHVDRETVQWLCQYREDCRKARARSIKFGKPYVAPPPLTASLPWSQARRMQANVVAAVTNNRPSEEEQNKLIERFAKFGTVPLAESSSSSKTVPLSEGWDKLELVGSVFRVDPPEQFWNGCATPTGGNAGTPNDFAMNVVPPVLVPEKIHVCSIDWVPFKQIRNSDIMAYFSPFRPLYVEWLGDLSCNVLFGDAFSATRALETLSRPLPSPPPFKPSQTEEGTDQELPDLGRMGWRLGNQRMRKIANDRYGKRGTNTRLLLRVSTSLDILIDRPKEWPQPPNGYTSKHVLGPESDLPRAKNRTKKGRQQPSKNSKSTNVPEKSDHLPTKANKPQHHKPPRTMLRLGLGTERDGFTEDVEAVRSPSKKAKLR